MNRLCCALLLLLMLGARGSQTAPLRLRVLTYNIHHGEGMDGRIDLSRLAGVVRSVHPDLVALQEVDERTERASGVDELAELARLTDLHAVFGKAMDFAGGEYGVAVLSRFPLLHPHNDPLPRLADHEPRTALTVDVAVDHGPHVAFTSTHFDQARDPENRLAQARYLNERLVREDDHPTILAGDFNARPNTPVMDLLEERWANLPAADPSPISPSGRPRLRVDYVLLRPATRWRVVESSFVNEAVASDHRPLLVVLEWAGAASPAATPDAHAGFDGVWNSATATPLERPPQWKDRAFFSPDEAAEWERQLAEANQEPSPQTTSRNRGTGTYNTFFREYGSRIVKTLRTSIVTDPADGRIPALTPAAAEIKQRRVDGMKNAASAQDTGLQDQCLAFATAGPPMLPYSYNSNYQILQTKDAFVVHAEMMHDARIIHLDGRPHLPSAIRRWMGDSVGRWAGDTLVVDTTNFNDTGGFYGDAGGNFGWDRDLHVVERFSLLDADTLLYRFEIDDPGAFTHPWKGELTMARSSGPIYEYACHEGNYSLPNMLRGFRAGEP